jgi:bifunctional non-homologous end joining protein LigD
MALEEYRKKRKFTKTPEPTGGKSKRGTGLKFVVQKHAASRLHYDFRLEVDGVLKSWAVPKGPSLNPKDKRLAMMVEDHPFDYRTFEGTIPEGNYGAGTVMVWDQGEVVGVESKDRAGSERELRDGLEKGRLSFVLQGEKLRGEFSLVKMNRRGENAWLLMKKRDEFASEEDVLAEGRSVISGRNLDEIAEGARPKKRTRTQSGAKRATPGPAAAVVEPLPPARNGRFITPMLATLVDEPFDKEGWVFEVKWDGFRAIAETTSRTARLYSRNQKSFDERFRPIAEALRGLGRTAVFDGEIVVLDEQGRSHFQLLQNYQRTGEGDLRYYVFDLLKLDRRDLRRLPLVKRKKQLAEVIEGLPNILLSEHVEERGIDFFRAAQEQGLEGIIAKNGASIYRDGVRSENWLKIKTHRRQEAVIGGYTEPKGSRKELGALVLGVFEGDKFVYIGHTGGGFNTESLGEVRARLEKLQRKTCPFAEVPKTNTPAKWVSPKLVCEVRFQEWTQDGRMRQPIFLGLREDKEAAAVVRELPKSASAASARATKKTGSKSATRAKKSSSPKRAATKSASSEELKLTNLDKIYWPNDGYTKGDLIDYYRTVAPVLLPLLKDRPMSLHRHPNGIGKPSFFQKDVSNQPPPDWVETIDLHSESTNENVKFIVCQNEDSLLYIANLGCIELNPWHSRIPDLDNPDYMLIDLDPQGQPFDEVVRTALTVRRILENAGATTLCKTSGKRGIHIVVPLAAKYDYDTVRQFAEIVANMTHAESPETTSVVRSPSKRRNKIYLDFLQNSRGQTVAAPYSVRPAPGATVSTPLKWSEVKKGLDTKKFTIKTTPRRLDRVGDLWKPVLGKGSDLEKVLKRLRRDEK